MKKVSIIVPVYNVEKYLNRCIESLVNQSYDNLEIILINDGSTDSSGSICEKWGEVNDNIIVIKQENKGVSEARNRGLEIATGDYVMFVDPDDWCELNMVEKMMEKIDSADLTYCAYFVDTDKYTKTIKNAVTENRYTIEEIYTALFFGSKNRNGADLATALWRGIFKMQIIKDHNIRFDTYIRFAEDWLFYASYFKYVKSVNIIEEPLYHYYQRKDSLMHVYNPATKLGVQKSCYILNRFLCIANETEIDGELYEDRMVKRYVGLVLNQVKNVCNDKNPMKINEKYEFMKWVIKEVDLKEMLEKHRNVKLDVMNKIMSQAIENNNIFLLFGYGICYNMIRNMKKVIKKI